MTNLMIFGKSIAGCGFFSTRNRGRFGLIRRAATLSCGVALVAGAPAGGGELPSSLAECAACHGEDGIGRDVEIPNLAGQSELYLYRQLQNFKTGKRPHKEMRYESRQLSDEEMRALARYYSQLAR